ncbi:auxin-responsive protein SAUR71-like [Trifolium pratense]|uniref:auxin-responsive protein SAUR71-like n=1 Tax=Trifolium pratense TaxID=57577 RepID=UPI001E6943FD|nr:auxin-responsive protein SAUR71-like [Trifolium pratense]
MDFVKKCKKVWGSNKRLYDHQESSTSGSYGKLSEKSRKKDITSKKLAPNGCICVYVGPERQRFVIKIKIFNHPLFKTFLEDVENEYGYTNDGPLWLPCHVDLFCEALMEMESDENVGCNFQKSHKHNSVSPSSLSCRSNNMSCSDVNYQLLV